MHGGAEEEPTWPSRMMTPPERHTGGGYGAERTEERPSEEPLLDNYLTGDIGAQSEPNRVLEASCGTRGGSRFLPKHGVDVVPPPVRPMAEHVVPAVVGAVVAAELKLPLALKNG
jgi:hypothetical protein